MKRLIVFFSLFLPPLLYGQTISLEEAIALSKQNNYSVQLADYDIHIAAAKVDELKSNLMPKLMVALDYKYYFDLPYQLLPASVFGGPAGNYKEAQFGVPHNLNVNAQLNYAAYNPALRANIKTAESGVEIMNLQKLKSKEDISVDVANVYYNAQLLANQVLFIDSNIANNEKLLNLTKLLYEQRMAKGTDLDKVALQLSQFKTQKENVENQYRQAINLLKFLTGKDPHETVDVQTEPGGDNVTEQADKRIIDLKLAASQVDLLEKEKNAIEKSRLPVVSLNLLYGTIGYGKTGTNDYLKFFPLSYAGIQVAVPIYGGNSIKRKIRTKDIELQKAKTRIEMLEDKNEVDKINNQYQINNARNTLRITREQINYAQTIYNKTLLQQKEGIATLTDVLLADAAIREAQQNYINNLIALRKAELDYKKITGNL